MAQVKQIGPGRKTSGTIDGITYVTRNGKTYVRSTPTMPVSAYRTPAARKRQAIFTLNANAGDNTVIIIVAENGSTTTYNSDGTTVTVNGSGNENQTQTGGSSTGGNTGGGTETPVTVAAPTITGTTPFEETTEVTINGPAGATIYYTLDGSTPTHSTGSGQANGQLYTEPITLTETTTVKAIAIKDGVSSSVASKTLTKGSGNGGGVQGED